MFPDARAIWLLLYLAAYIIHSFRPDYVLPGNLMAVCRQGLGIFFGSKASKYPLSHLQKSALEQSVCPQAGY